VYNVPVNDSVCAETSIPAVAAMDASRLATFAGLWFLLGLSPGPNAAFCVATGLEYRLRQAMAVPVGIGFASLVHVSVAAVGGGRSSLARSPAAFQTLKFAGAGYLAWLGVIQWRSAGDPQDCFADGDNAFSGSQLLARGMAVSLSNPKAILQYVAVLSQFVDSTDPAARQFVALALVGAPIVVANYAIYTAAASGLARRFSGDRARSLRRATVAVYIIAAAVLATK